MGNVATMYADHLTLAHAVWWVEEIPNMTSPCQSFSLNKPVYELVKLIGDGVGVDKDPFVFYTVKGTFVLHKVERNLRVHAINNLEHTQC